MRITNSMISRQYVSNLNTTLSNLNDSITKATTNRAFQKASEDPYSAAKAYRLRRELQSNQDSQDAISDVKSQLSTAESSMQAIYSRIGDASTGDCIQAITGTTSAADRTTIATKLRTVQQDILSSLNTQFSNKYIFGGTQTDETPFTLDGNGNLLFRGVDVNTGDIAAGTTTTLNGSTIQYGKNTGTAFNGYTIKVAAGAAGSTDTVTASGTEITVTMDLTSNKTNKDLLSALKNATGLTDAGGNALDLSGATMTGKLDMPLTDGLVSAAAYDNVGEEGLKALANETSYVDIGIGLNFKADGTIDSSTAFNTAIPGLSFMGYGAEDGSGISNNLYTLMGQIADQLTSDSYSYESIQPYLNAFSKQSDGLMGQITKLGTQSNYLDSKLTNLQSMSTSITEKDDKVEYVDTAQAYIDYTQQSSAYSAALQMGTHILLPTFLDFMK